MGVYSLAQARDQLSRLVDEALSGELVMITRRGKPVVSLTPNAPARKPITSKFLAQMRDRARGRPIGDSDSVTLVREMRDGER